MRSLDAPFSFGGLVNGTDVPGAALKVLTVSRGSTGDMPVRHMGVDWNAACDARKLGSGVGGMVM